MGLRVTAQAVDNDGEDIEGDLWIIADGSNLRGPGGKLAVDAVPGGLFKVRYDVLIDPGNFIDADEQTRFDRGNHRGDAPISVEHEFASGEECFLFVTQLQHKVPVLADVRLSFGSAAVIARKVALYPIEAQFIGEVACRITYPFTFGKFELVTG